MVAMCVDGKQMACRGCTEGLVNGTWRVHGGHVQDAWRVHRGYREVFRVIARCTEGVQRVCRRPCGGHLDSTWGSCGGCMEGAQRVHGGHMKGFRVVARYTEGVEGFRAVARCTKVAMCAEVVWRVCGDMQRVHGGVQSSY